MRPPIPALTLPLSVAWHARTSVVIESIVAHDDVAIALSSKTLIGLDLATGHERWRRPIRGGIGPIPTTSRGPVLLDNDKGVSTVRAFDWKGEPRWSLRRDWFIPGDGLICERDMIMCAGRDNDSGAQVCAYVDDAAGKITAEYACAGVQPRAIAGGFLYRGEGSAGEYAGLFRVLHPTGKAERLTSLVVQDYMVAGGVAVVNAGEDTITELVAIDLTSGDVRWRQPCGMLCKIAVDGDDVVTGVCDGDRIGVVLRSLRDGTARWTAPLVPRSWLRPILVTPTLVIAFGADDHVDLHDRKSGAIVQRLETSSGYAGGAIAGASLVDVRQKGEVVCWRGA